jgi:acetyl esterase/lipase
MNRTLLFLILGFGWMPATARGDESTAYDRKEDVIYARKFGSALTMDVFTPKANANSAGVIWCVSGGWFSGHEVINIAFLDELLKRGYTVFAVVHGSQPKYTIPEVLQDMHRAVRFIRHRAKDYHVDPDRIGITGGSAGGHLSLMQGTAGDAGKEDAKDPVDRESSRVQAVACFFPPTDFLNYGKPEEIALGCGILKDFKAPFDFHEWDPTRKAFMPITDVGRILAIGRQISPVYQISPDDPPTLIIHGDKDPLVPIQQAELFLDKLKASGVETKLVVKTGEGHGWKDWHKDMAIIADWFDAHLKPKKESASGG